MSEHCPLDCGRIYTAQHITALCLAKERGARSKWSDAADINIRPQLLIGISDAALGNSDSKSTVAAIMSRSYRATFNRIEQRIDGSLKDMETAA